jgi:prepilin-type N-terminal cleavage/methylation domain-containing protein
VKQAERGVTLIELLVAMTLLSLLSVGVLFGLRIGLNAMERTNDRLMTNRRVLGVERVLTQQIAGFMPVVADCVTNAQGPPARFPFFQGEAQTMRFVSTYSLNEASRGYPRILEYQVIPGEDGLGVRLIVNEWLYSGPLSAGRACVGVVNNPPQINFRPVEIGPASFVLADKLARCQFFYKEEQQLPKPDLWSAKWTRRFAPAAIRVELSPLSPDPARLEVPSIVAPIHTRRNPDFEYTDWESDR